MESYARYRIERNRTSNVLYHPHPFLVKIRRWQLFKLLWKEIFHYKNKRVVKNSPCAYGVFSGPIGGFAPREKLCVGCLRCTTEYPKISTILHNPERKRLGDANITPEQVDRIMYEAERGNLSVKGAGYRGKFGGKGWDGMWTDMSEIVRPTRDGIYGREHISTEFYLGQRPTYIHFSATGEPVGPIPRGISVPFPILFHTHPSAFASHPKIAPILAETAEQLKNYVFLPFDLMMHFSLKSKHIIPIIEPNQWREFKRSALKPQFLSLTTWNPSLYQDILNHLPETSVILQTPFEADLLYFYKEGVRLFHLRAYENGKDARGKFMIDLIRKAHMDFVEKQCRDQVTLIGSGGFTAAEQIPKALLLGLDAVSVDIPLLIALQAQLQEENTYLLSKKIKMDWGVQRLKNLIGAWQDQIFECAGAMGFRETRRMRGEIGRALFQSTLEREAFLGIEGYEAQY